MKLDQLKMNNFTNNKGTYAGVHFDSATNKSIMKFIKDNNISNPVIEKELHSTLLYSKKNLPNYNAKGKIDPPYIAIPDHFEVWNSGNKKTKVLVLVIICPELVNRHVFLMREHRAEYDYPEYIPHVTFSYDVGNNLDLNKLNKFTSIIKIVEEYKTDIEE